MNLAPKILMSACAAATLAGCATARPPVMQPSPISGYTIGYRILNPAKGTSVAASVVSGENKTWISLPKGVTLLQANADGRPVTVQRQGPYWVAPTVATLWKLYTNAGPVEAMAPASVGVILAAEKQHKAEQPHYVWQTRTDHVAFTQGAALTHAGQQTLRHLAGVLNQAHKVDWVRVSGQTTPSGTVAENARIGAQRAAVVSDWLKAHGVSAVEDRGWVRGGDRKAALIVARYQTQMKPPVKVAAKPMPPVKVATKVAPPVKAIAKPSVTHAVTLSQKASHSLVFTTHPGDLLSQDMGAFLKAHGWSLVWRDHYDYALQYAAQFKAQTLTDLLQKVVQRYGIRIVLYKQNHVAVVEAGR
ncbi:TcpQ domain-containing protein [Acidihalobacter ferrooxydans]|uniref:OmpA-like domain-containing protein n=1 Tax=Acidihalobacter ferrooxydans TaxID=1765967 RepID=A0A1P8UFH3_9GAMM|nr:OmpA family protein [Acidihalobacter ferrooxydans]APZ42549.1 hypothetical protein BW247_05115 [Acidihalobacter ferrooxydans]